MEKYSTQVIELLSLGKVPDGCFWIRIGVTHKDRQASYIIDIDEYTYLHLDALQPLHGGGRVRLSPYPKWDPYRNTYYCTMFRTSQVSRETLYFACSEAFMEQMRRIRMMEPPFVPNDEEHGEDVAGTAVEDAVQSRERRRFSERAVLMAVRLLIISSFFLLLSFGFEENMLMDLSDHASRSIGSVKAATTHEATSNKAAIIQVAVNKAATDEAQREASLQPIAFASTGEGLAGDDEKSPQAELADEPAEGLPDQTNPVLDPLPSADIEKDYEVFEIEGDKSFYKLPKEYVALTFDDGPSAFTEKIVDILAEQDVAATFLFVGRNVARRPEAVIYASRHGMSIGNHSWDHRELTKLSPADQAENIAKASSVLESLTHVPVTLFRPPYGSINDSLYSKAKEQHMRILMWNRDPEDWNAKKPDEIVKYFHECDASGGVFVLHEDMMTLEALPDIIKYLKGKNLKFATFK